MGAGRPSAGFNNAGYLLCFSYCCWLKRMRKVGLCIHKWTISGLIWYQGFYTPKKRRNGGVNCCSKKHHMPD
jgi:hypothetical protein